MIVFTKHILACSLLFFLAIYSVNGQTSLWKTLPRPPAMPKADKSGLATVNGIKIYYAIYNETGKNPVLLLHGGFASSDCWGFEVPLLSMNHKVIVVDSRGHGRSSMDDTPFSYQLMTSDMMKLLDYLKIKKVSIVGWSDGGIIGLLTAIHHPERVNKLYTFGANFSRSGYKSEIPDTALVKVYMARVQANYKRLSSTPDGFLRLRKALVKMYSEEPEIDTNEIKTIHSPVVIAGGEYDQFIKQEHFEKLAQLIPGARLVIIPNVGHGGVLQDPVTFHEEVIKLLDSN